MCWGDLFGAVIEGIAKGLVEARYCVATSHEDLCFIISSYIISSWIS